MIVSFPHNPLEQQLVEAQAGRVGIEEWLRSLVDATVFVPVTSGGGTSASLPVLTIDGRPYVPVFTSEEELRGSQPDATAISPVLRDLLGGVSEAVGISVNPGRSVSLAVPPEDVRRVAGGTHRVEAGTRVRIGHPATEPEELLAALAAAVTGLGSVREMRRAWAAVGDNRPGLVVGVDLDPDNEPTRQTVLAAVREAAVSRQTDYAVDVVFVNDRGPLVEWMWENADPFHSASA
jgi:hypothetical protein